MKKLRLFDSLKFVVAAIVCTFMFVSAHADNTWKYAPLPIGYAVNSDLVELTESNESFNTYTVKETKNTSRRMLYITNANPLPANHKYFMRVRFNSNLASLPYFRYALDGTYTDLGYSAGYNTSCRKNEWCNVAQIITPQQKLNLNGNSDGLLAANNSYTAGETITIDKNGFLTVFDLTEIFGAGNEPATAADAERALSIDTTIKIATTRYNEEQFEPVQNRLSAAVNAVEDVVSQTMSQAQAIDTIATTKQTRPDESCPPFKKCLLVEGEDGTPHWYEIYDPINDFLRPILAAAEMSGNRGAPTQTTHTSGSSTIYDTYNGFYKTNNIFKNQYVSGTVSAQNRPFGPTTLPRCDDNATRNTLPTNAGICYNTGGMFRDLTNGPADDAGEWAVVYDDNEGAASLGITPGVVYGVAKCTSVGQHTTQMTGDVAVGSNYWWPKKLTEYSNTTLSSLIEQYPNVVDVFNTLPNPVGTDEKPGYPRENFRNCWCKMTAIGVPGAGGDFTAQAANGTIMSVSGDWVFDRVIENLNSCVGQCAYYCTSLVMVLSKSRKAVFTAN